MHFGWSWMSRVKDLPQITLQWGTSQCTEAPSPQKRNWETDPLIFFLFWQEGASVHRLVRYPWRRFFGPRDLIPVFSIPNTTGVRASNSPQTELIKFFRWVPKGLRRWARMAEALWTGGDMYDQENISRIQSPLLCFLGMTNVWISKPIFSSIEKKAKSMFLFYCCICTYLYKYLLMQLKLIFVSFVTVSSVLCPCFKTMSLIGIFFIEKGKVTHVPWNQHHTSTILWNTSYFYWVDTTKNKCQIYRNTQTECRNIKLN